MEMAADDGYSRGLHRPAEPKPSRDDDARALGPAPGEERQPTAGELAVIQRAFGIVEDGYGGVTRRAVADLQLAHDIPVDSAVTIGPRTWALILAAAEAEPIAPPPPTAYEPDWHASAAVQRTPERPSGRPSLVWYGTDTKYEYWASEGVQLESPDDRKPAPKQEQLLCREQVYAGTNACYRPDLPKLPTEIGTSTSHDEYTITDYGPLRLFGFGDTPTPEKATRSIVKFAIKVAWKLGRLLIP